MSKQISTKPPSGMRDFLPLDIARRRHVIGVIRAVYEAYGFVPLETPSIENLSTLLGKYGEEGDQLLYRLLHRRDALTRATEAAAGEGRPVLESELGNQGLRYDLTVPLARVIAQYGELPKFFRRYQIQPVWRADRPGRGRYREFWQCDVDVVGTASPLAEVDVCAAVATALERLGFASFTIRLNHRALLRSLIRRAGIADAFEGTALIAVDKLDKIGVDGVLAELGSRGIADDAARALLALIGVDGTDGEHNAARNAAEIARLRAADLDASGVAAVDELEALLAIASDTVAGPHLAVSADLARGLGYYTGPIYEVTVPDLAGALGGGGRYDGLVGMFSRREIPAVGFSLGLERILVVMEERGLYPGDLAIGPEIVLCHLDVSLPGVAATAARLRGCGLRVEVYPEPAKLKKQLQYAVAGGATFAAIVGSAELEAGTVAIKHLPSGTQETAPLSGVGEVVTRLRAVPANT